MTRYSFAGTDTVWRVVVHIPEQSILVPKYDYSVSPPRVIRQETQYVKESTTTYGPYANRTPAVQVRNKERKFYEKHLYQDVTVELEEAKPDWKVIDV